MSMVDSPHVRATIIPFILFVAMTLFVWRIWGQRLTMLLLITVLVIIVTRDYMARKRFSQ